jgi:integrase
LHAGDAAPQTRLNNLRVVRQFFGWARRAGYLPRAVPTAADDVEAPRVPPGHIEIFRPADIAKLLAALTGPARAYVAIGAFAGLRSAEILRLRWEDIGATHIRVGARASKTRQMRLVPIADNLRAWLSTCGQTTGPVAHQYDQRHAAATARTLDVRWVPNGLRHSYGSYRLAATNDLAALALEMGNSGSVILQHYRQLVTPDAAAAWWAITPERPANVADFVA